MRERRRVSWRWAAYVWSAPSTLLGLGIALVALAGRGKLRLRDGVLEVQGAVPRWLLRAAPLAGGAAAMTLGHVVLGQDDACLRRTRAHERVHVRQCERWGPFFLPAYGLASFWALLRGGHVYRDNWFERQAVKEATNTRVRPGDLR